MKEITAAELKTRLESAQPAVTLLDIREAPEFAAWHIAGSRNLPVYEALKGGRVAPLVDHLGDIPRDGTVITICRGGFVSRTAAEVLRAHGFDAASLVGGMRGWGAVWTEAAIPLPATPGARLVQVRRNGKGCLSYVLGSRGEAIVVDPCVDPAAYVACAARGGATVRHVVETHVHADHVSRARAVCALTGADLMMPPNERVTFPFTPLPHGTRIEVGGVPVEVIATPGHTAESVCLLVADQVLLSGDTLFVDGVGRPDLERGDAGAAAGARALHRSLHGTLLARFDDVRVHPGHHAGPIGVDGEPIGASLGQLRQGLEPLALAEEPFVGWILGRLGTKPPSFDTIMAVNEGRASLEGVDPLDLEAGPNRCAAR